MRTWVSNTQIIPTTVVFFLSFSEVSCMMNINTELCYTGYWIVGRLHSWTIAGQVPRLVSLSFNIQWRHGIHISRCFFMLEYHKSFFRSHPGSYLVMPFMGTDLGKLMKMERLSEDRVQFLVYQMLRGLKVRDTLVHKCILFFLFYFIIEKCAACCFEFSHYCLFFLHSISILLGSFTEYVTSDILIICMGAGW